MEAAELIGETLDGRVELEELLGEGAYGAVFRGTQLSVGRSCAVKVVSPDVGADPASVERFCQEAEATSRLTSPHTVTVYDFGRDEATSVLFLVMELLEGRSVRDVVESDGPMSLVRVADVVDQAASSLREAHRGDVVHRDVKPDHLMLVDRDGDDCFVKVIDFGIAKAFRPDFDSDGDFTHTGRLVGTPGFMAPEQIRSGEVDGAVDQYALGLTTYLMASGEVPFEGGSPMEVVSRHLTEQPPVLSALVDDRDVPEAVDAVVARSVAKRPEDRFPSIRAFADALSLAVSRDEGGGARRETEGGRADVSTADVERASEEAKRRLHFGVALCLGLALLTGAAGGALYFLQTSRSGEGAGARGMTGDTWSSTPTAVATNPAEDPGLVESTRPASVGRDVSADGGNEDPDVEWTETRTEKDADGRVGEKVHERAADGSDVGRDVTRESTTGRTVSNAEGPSPPGRLEVRMIPWGTLYLDGDEVDRGTRVSHRVEPGRHELEVRQNGSTVAERTVRVPAGRSVDVEMVTR